MRSSKSHNEKLTRIGVFIDGNYFSHVNTYYNYYHEINSRINMKGLQRFILSQVSKEEDPTAKHCRIVDAHYFRGRLNAAEAREKHMLYGERVFDEILMREGITTHYLPLSGGGEEKGIDVWLALEAFELAIYKRFDVCVLIAGDGDYLPLIRKLNILGTRVMVLGWNFSYEDRFGEKRYTRTAQTLLDEATYPILIDHNVDDQSIKSDLLINNVFEQIKPTPQDNSTKSNFYQNNLTDDFFTGEIITIEYDFGFIKPENGENLFFHASYLENCKFNDLGLNDDVVFKIGENEQGPCAKHVSKKS